MITPQNLPDRDNDFQKKLSQRNGNIDHANACGQIPRESTIPNQALNVKQRCVWTKIDTGNSGYCAHWYDYEGTEHKRMGTPNCRKKPLQHTWKCSAPWSSAVDINRM